MLTAHRAVCPHDCPDTCSMIVTVDDGRAVRIAGDPDHAFTQGSLCTKVNKYLERTYHPDRLLHPMIRTGPKGAGQFRRVSWDEALDLVATRLRAVIDSVDGPQAILPYSYAGTMGLIQSSSMDRRFFQIIGASLLDRTICASAGVEALNRTYGVRMGTDPETIGASRLILIWGSNTLTSNPHLWRFIRQAHDAGARTICIDPIRTRTADLCDEHIAIRPGTDAALALGMMHVIFRDGLENRGYLESMTIGWEKLRYRALSEYSPERVAGICRLDPAVIERLGSLYATTHPSFIRLNYGLQRHAGGGSAVRAISILPALTGEWDLVGGGCQLSSSGTYGFDTDVLERPDLIRPGTRTINMSAIGDALTKIDDPPVRAMVVYNSNPATIAPDRERVLAGLAREDLFTVVMEHFQTDTADWADVLLPATTQLEHWDIHKGYGHLYVMLNKPVIEPVGESLPNTEIFRRLAKRMGVEHSALDDSDETMIRQSLQSDAAAMRGITFETLRDKGPQRLSLPSPHLPFPSGTRLPTPSGRIEIECQSLVSIGLDPLPVYVPPWESEERDPSLVARFPLALISPPAHSFLNSTFVNVDRLRQAEGRPTIQVHPEDADRRGLKDGMKARIWNDRGRFTAEVVVTDRVKRGVVSAPSVWWGKLTDDGANANQTTSQRLTDLGGGATFYDNQVEVSATEV